MTTRETISQRLPDDTIEVWLDGWHLRFPPDDERPTVERASPPASPQYPTTGLVATVFASGHAIRQGSWIVAVTQSDFTVILADPDEDDTLNQHRYRYFRL